MEFWDIYDSDKKQTGRTMKRNDWNLKNGEAAWHCLRQQEGEGCHLLQRQMDAERSRQYKQGYQGAV